LADTRDGSFELGLGRGVGIDISTSERSETPSSGSKSIGSLRWSPCAFPFPFVGFSCVTADLRWDCFERDDREASSLSVTTIASTLPWDFSSGLAWILEYLGAVDLRGAADFLAILARQSEK